MIRFTESLVQNADDMHMDDDSPSKASQHFEVWVVFSEAEETIGNNFVVS
jgi:hypothetical protein